MTCCCNVCDSCFINGIAVATLFQVLASAVENVLHFFSKAKNTNVLWIGRLGIDSSRASMIWKICVSSECHLHSTWDEIIQNHSFQPEIHRTSGELKTTHPNIQSTEETQHRLNFAKYAKICKTDISQVIYQALLISSGCHQVSSVISVATWAMMTSCLHLAYYTTGAFVQSWEIDC